MDNMIPSNEHPFKENDVFTTSFWGDDEVCIVQEIRDGLVTIIRLEAIKEKRQCRATFTEEEFNLLQKRFLHSSKWYHAG